MQTPSESSQKETRYVLDSESVAEDATYQDWKIALKLIQPFLITMKVTTQEEADALYEQAMTEMLSNDFTAIVYFLSVWGEKP